MSSGDIGRDEPRKIDVEPPGASVIIAYEITEIPSSSGTRPISRRTRNVPTVGSGGPRRLLRHPPLGLVEHRGREGGPRFRRIDAGYARVDDVAVVRFDGPQHGHGCDEPVLQLIVERFALFTVVREPRLRDELVGLRVR